jgi:hypothetical protein
MEQKLRPCINPHTDFQEPQPQIIRLMQTLGVEPERVKNSLKTDAYDNFHGIYLLLLERLGASNPFVNNNVTSIPVNSVPSSVSTSSTGVSSMVNSSIKPTTPQNLNPPPAIAPTETRTKRRQSDAPAPSPRRCPPLNTLRDHSTFQTTDCIILTNPPVPSTQYAHSDYEENCSTLSRQSTIGTIGSIDEGVESDVNGSCQSRGAFSSSEIESNGSGHSLLVVTNNSPFDSFDSQIETDIMSSLGSYQSQENSGEVCCSGNVQQNSNVLTTLSNSSENSPCSSPQPKNFGEGLASSDNAMFDSLATTAFPTGQLGEKSKAVPEMSR